MSQAQLELINLRKRYGATAACDDVSLEVGPEEFLTILGPSGSGKTTLLMMIAGFTQPDEGRIILAGTDVTRLPAQRRNIGVVFQNYSLFPHLSVYENLAYPLRVRRERDAVVRERVAWALDLVQLSGLEQRKPGELSGGQQQRIAVARAVIFQPRLLLMDEPLGALDKKLRDYMQVELKALQRRLRTAFVYVTHDQDEALSMSDRIAVVDRGRIAQLDTPRALYQSPANRFVAEFLGDAVMLEAVVREGRETPLLEVAGRMITATAKRPLAAGDRVTVMIRPEAIALAASGDNRLSGRVEELVFLGDHVRCRIAVTEHLSILVKHPSHVPVAGLAIGSMIEIGWWTRDATVL